MRASTNRLCGSALVRLASISRNYSDLEIYLYSITDRPFFVYIRQRSQLTLRTLARVPTGSTTLLYGRGSYYCVRGQLPPLSVLSHCRIKGGVRMHSEERVYSQRMVATVRRVRAGRDSRTEARTAPMARRRLFILSFSISMNRASCSRLTIKKSRMNGISRSPSTPCATAAPPRLPTHWQRARSATSMDHMRPQNTPSAPRNISHSCRGSTSITIHKKNKLNLATKVLARCTMRPH